MIRKKILGLTAAAMILLGVVANVNIATQKNGLSDISLANVEALAGETTIIFCDGPIIVRCVSGIDFWGQKTGEITIIY